MLYSLDSWWTSHVATISMSLNELLGSPSSDSSESWNYTAYRGQQQALALNEPRLVPERMRQREDAVEAADDAVSPVRQQGRLDYFSDGPAVEEQGKVVL